MERLYLGARVWELGLAARVWGLGSGARVWELAALIRRCQAQRSGHQGTPSLALISCEHTLHPPFLLLRSAPRREVN